MGWKTCDVCQGEDYKDANPFVHVNQRRPSDPSEMCCVMAGHLKCMGGSLDRLPSICESGGIATPAQWEAWIESPEAAKAGFLFCT